MEPELLIWNLDGPVIDTSDSYPSTIRRTVQDYFSMFLNIQGVGSLVQREDIQAWRLAGGFHNPIELTTAFIRYLLSLLPGQFPRNNAPRGVAEAISFLRRGSQPVQNLSREFFEERVDFQGVAKRIGEAGGGRKGLVKVIRGGWSHSLLMDEGEGNLVRLLFLEIYLGRKQFARLERQQPRLYRGPGQFENETLVLEVGVFEQLHGRYRGRMALVTSRPLEQARVVTRERNLERLFDTIVAGEDMAGEEARLRRVGEPESLEPPHPYMVLEAASRLDPGGSRGAVYIGDAPVEMRAATRAAATGERPVTGWGLITPAAETALLRQYLMEAGAEEVFDSPAALAARLLD